MNQLPEVSVLGLGHWGTALANHLAMQGCDVLGWTIEADIIESINSKNRNARYLSEIPLDPNLRATGEIEETLPRKIVLMAFPSFALKEVVPRLRVQPDTLIISAIKGLDSESLRTPLQIVAEGLPAECQPPKVKLAVLSGPSFAKDVIAKRPVGIVAASESESAARTVADLFSSESMKVYVSTDPLGVELGGIVKNVIAVAAGVCDGLDLGDSARAGLITRGLAEIMRLAVAMGADAQTLSGLSGLGDLALTATCDTSRNRTVGLRLGQGETLDHIVTTLGSVAEGVKTAPLVLKLAEKYGVEMPITVQVTKLLAGEITAPETVRALVRRPIRAEFCW